MGHAPVSWRTCEVSNLLLRFRQLTSAAFQVEDSAVPLSRSALSPEWPDRFQRYPFIPGRSTLGLNRSK